eukprot:TRINITY_DN46941_c0_g1_i1.p2 TRINITY_DN46941_c0_g1~~TRINITY_DN46941_c0_g1_i1.p2  ORF type:complete len:406 (-),score=44.05 TRINITY_DN46941_c0_g1_i1:2213-3430(-)
MPRRRHQPLPDDEATNETEELLDSFIVVDVGSSTIRAGWPRSDAPRAVFPNFVGKPRLQPTMVGAPETTIGDQAAYLRGVMALEYPVTRGVVTNWENMEKVWHHCFYNELRIDPTEHGFMVTEGQHSPPTNRATHAELLFETFGVHHFTAAPCPLLALYASGRCTGIVAQCGYGVTDVYALWESHPVLPEHARTAVNVSGMDTTTHLATLLNENEEENGYSFDTSGDLYTLDEAKKDLAYVAEDYHKELDAYKGDDGKQERQDFQLPDGHIIQLGHETCSCMEPLFQPQLLGMDENEPGLPTLIDNAICTVDKILQAGLYTNIVFAGGTCLANGFRERIEHEFGRLLPAKVKRKIIIPPETKYSVYIGGTILASLLSAASIWTSKEEYEEVGPACLWKQGSGISW